MKPGQFKLLSLKGSAPGAGDVRRDKSSKEIIATMVAIDTDEHVGRISQSVIELFKSKASMTYSNNTALVIAFDAIKLYGAYNWRQLFASLEQAGGLSGSGFISVYLFNSATNELQRAA